MASYIYIALFMILFLVVLFGGHYFLYFSIVRFFAISAILKKVLLISFAFLSISFILASLLTQLNEGFLVKDFYFISGFWLGFLFYLMLASAVVWLILGVGKVFSLNINLSSWAVVFLTSALLVSVYGVWNAFNLQVKNITVDIPNLPLAWENKKIVQISDVHLGLVHREGLMKKIVEKTNSINPEVVVITGDLFDGMDGQFDFLLEWIGKIRAKKGIYFVTGNHETYLGTKKVFDILEKTKITILKDEVIDLDGLKLIGIGYPERDEKKDVVTVVNSLQKVFFNQPNVLLYHSPVFINQFKEAGINLQLSGHAHDGQISPIGFISELIYKGYSYGLYQMGNYTLYATSGAGTWGPTMRVGTHSEITTITVHKMAIK